MSETPDWLPVPHPLRDFSGTSVRAYLDLIYRSFWRDFVDSRPAPWEGKRFFIRRHPYIEEREAGFWHCITEGTVEPERTPDFHRCARIAWIRPMFEAVESDRVVWWKSLRKDKMRRLIALPDFSYVVILAEKEDCFVLLTAYPVSYPHRRDDFRREHERYWHARKNNAAP